MSDFAEHSVRANPETYAAETALKARMSYLERISGNGFTPIQLFSPSGEAQPEFVALLKHLPLIDKDTGVPLVETLQRDGKLDLAEIESVLQRAFYKTNESKFSFEVASDGAAPSDEQYAAFQKFGLVDEIRIQPGIKYDTGVVFGGLLGAINSRTKFLLDQNAELGSIALLGSKRALFGDRELGEALTKVIGAEYHEELKLTEKEPKTEHELMLVVWEAFCRRDNALREIPVIAIDSRLRVGNIRVAPGTPETVVDLANTIVEAGAIPGLQNAPSSFLIASSQPHAFRQREDFVSSMAVLNFPGLQQVDVVGYATAPTTSLKLFSQEVAKLVHAQFLERA